MKPDPNIYLILTLKLNVALQVPPAPWLLDLRVSSLACHGTRRTSDLKVSKEDIMVIFEKIQRHK
jgi:hypothetical protein